MENSKLTKFFDFGFLLVLLYILFPFFYLFDFIFPIGDDVCINSGNEPPSWLGKAVGGRYSCYYLVYWLPILNLTWFRILPIIFIIGFGLSFDWLIKGTLNLKSTLLQRLIVILSLVSCLFLLMPSVASQFYWFTGLANYFVPFIFIIFFIGIMYEFIFQYRFSIILFILSILINIVICFFHEIFAFLIGLCLVYFLVFEFVKNKIKYKSAISFLIANTVTTLISSILILKNPGNQRRRETSSSNFDLGDILEGFRATFEISIQKFLVEWITNPIFLLIIIYLFTLQISPSRKPFLKPSFRRIGVFTIFLLALYILSILPAGMAFKKLYWERIYNPNCMIFVLGLFIIVLSSVAPMFNSKLSIRIQNYFKAPIIIALLITSILYKSNVSLAYSDLYGGSALTYKLEMEQRLTNLSTTSLEATVRRTSVRPKTIFQEEMLNAPRYINCYKRYYKKYKIVVN